jgi:hypothetical protein
MSDDILSRLHAIDMAILTDVVRKDKHNPAFEISEWSVRRLSEKGMMNPDGLWLFSGQGHAGDAVQAWSVVLKIFNRPEEESPPDEPGFWRREMLLAQSGLLERLPGPVRGALLYRTDEYPDSIWLWMEYIVEQQSEAWMLEQYAFAASQLGQWSGALLTEKPFQEEQWFARRHYLMWLHLINVEKDWDFSLNQAYVPVELRYRYNQLWAEQEMFHKVLDALPKVFSHFDFQRRNLFIRPDFKGQDQLVAVDWAFCGLGPLGAELNGLVADNGIMLEWLPADLPALEAVAYPSYIEGLQEAGWTGETDLVRLGYVAWRAVYYALVFPAWIAWWCSDERASFASQIYGLAQEQLFWKLFPLLEFSLDGADEARQLMKKTKMV